MSAHHGFSIGDLVLINNLELVGKIVGFFLFDDEMAVVGTDWTDTPDGPVFNEDMVGNDHVSELTPLTPELTKFWNDAEDKGAATDHVVLVINTWR